MRATGETDRTNHGKQFRIGAWLVTPTLDELQRGAQRVRLEPKAMEVLVFLARRPGEPVSREELLSGVWPGVLVGDDALTQAVTKLRKALGDDARSPSYIETISKRGYRLVAAVDAPHGVAAEQLASGIGTPFAWRAPAVVALLTSVIAVAYLFWVASDKSGSPVVEDYLAEKLAVGAWSTLPTVTVMPFDPLPDQSEHAYLARSIVADLSTDLSRLAGLRVIGFSTVADQAPSAGALHSGARYVVSGSLQRAGDQLKVNVQLNDSQTGQQLWSERYERPFQDLFAIQEEIVARLVSALRVEVSEAERRRLASRHTRNLEAYDYFLRARAALWTRQRADNEKARELYREALRLDPKFARAYAGLALTYAADYRNQWTEQAPQALARAAELAETAFGIDPDILEVHWVLAYVHVQARRHDQAIAHLKRLITADRSFADAYSLLGSIHTYIGQPKKAVPMLRAAARLDPDRGHSYFVALGRTYFFLGDAEQASINLREALSRNAGNLEAHVYLAATLAVAGDREGASWEANEVRVLAPTFSTSKWLETYPMTDTRQKTQLIRLLAELGL
jgi:DNA-binding winged helix-turn-helix (wHTH) protein/TolB-like protein/cytochrome c-type biogenesis protein CcmH/NrfG